jgi:hypothetical protein
VSGHHHNPRECWCGIDHSFTGEADDYAADQGIDEAALRVVKNAYGTKPRHTQAREGGCRDDCIPCGLAALARCFPGNGIAARVAKALTR